MLTLSGNILNEPTETRSDTLLTEMTRSVWQTPIPYTQLRHTIGHTHTQHKQP